MSSITEGLGLVCSDILQASFPRQKLRVMDVALLPGNHIQDTQPSALRGLSSCIVSDLPVSRDQIPEDFSHTLSGTWVPLAGKNSERKEVVRGGVGGTLLKRKRGNISVADE